jgi:hypothetical protein
MLEVDVRVCELDVPERARLDQVSCKGHQKDFGMYLEAVVSSCWSS